MLKSRIAEEEPPTPPRAQPAAAPAFTMAAPARPAAPVGFGSNPNAPLGPLPSLAPPPTSVAKAFLQPAAPKKAAVGGSAGLGVCRDGLAPPTTPDGPRPPLPLTRCGPRVGGQEGLLGGDHLGEAALTPLVAPLVAPRPSGGSAVFQPPTVPVYQPPPPQPEVRSAPPRPRATPAAPRLCSLRPTPPLYSTASSLQKKAPCPDP